MYDNPERYYIQHCDNMCTYTPVSRIINKAANDDAGNATNKLINQHKLCKVV